MTTTIAGPFTEAQARETAAFLGNCNHSVYSRELKDAEGYGTNQYQWFVERDETAAPSHIFGMAWSEVQAKQNKR